METFHRWRDISMGHRQTRNRFISWTSKQFHPTIKFTAEISEKEITFLDTVVYKGERFQKDAILDIETHYKPTETFQYTHYTFCHPPGIKRGLSKANLLDFYEQIPGGKISGNLSLISKHVFSRVDTLKTWREYYLKSPSPEDSRLWNKRKRLTSKYYHLSRHITQELKT